MASASYMCCTCKGKFGFEEIRYSNDGKRIVCKSCYDRFIKTAKKEEGIPVKNVLSDSRKFICVNCKYKFSLKRKPAGRVMCPYCGGNQLMKDDITAEKLIQEVS